jgi:hypothetical protein
MGRSLAAARRQLEPASSHYLPGFPKGRETRPEAAGGFTIGPAQNVAKLTSEISSSQRVISWLIPVLCGAAIAADSPLTSDNDNPAAPKAGGSLRFEGCFLSDMVQLP